MSGALQDRLRQHAAAFDGLLSLIPAKLYYGNGDEPSEQWRRTKQTKEEKKAARRANLDPENELNKSVKELMEERAARNKRKLEDEDEDEDGSDEDSDGSVLEGVVKEMPREGLKPVKQQKKPVKGTTSKKTKPPAEKAIEENKGKEEEDKEEEEEEEEEMVEKTEVSLEEAKISKKQAEKLLKKQQKADRKAEKRKQKKAGKKEKGDDEEEEEEEEKKQTKAQKAKATVQDEADSDEESDKDDSDEEMKDGEEEEAGEDELQSGLDFSALGGSEEVLDEAAGEVKETASTTSVSSTGPTDKAGRPHIKVPSDTSALRARLAARIEALRAARKADGPDGKPIRTRQELIEARRVKQAERKQHKKQLRQQAREEEERKRDEAVASARASPLVRAGGSPVEESTNLSFGLVAFADGTKMSRDLTFAKGRSSGGRDDADDKATPKRKGPAASDVRGQLARLESQKKRLAGMDETTRREVEEKERWLAARRRAATDEKNGGAGSGLTAGAAASGAAVSDLGRTEMLLKKAIKRKDKAKKKSEREWSERREGVQKGIQERDRKREENLRARREDKLLRRSGLAKKKKGGAGGGGGKSKGRPGFEGSFGGKRK